MTENLLKNGDYVPDGFGGFVRKNANEGLLCEALFRLNCKRGSFPFLPELGSCLFMLSGKKKSEREPLALQYCAEALAPLGLTVRQVSVTEQANRQLSITVYAADETTQYTLEVTE